MGVFRNICTLNISFEHFEVNIITLFASNSILEQQKKLFMLTKIHKSSQYLPKSFTRANAGVDYTLNL